ncbi:winged helix-turn-helix transcriptional regulator [Antrihabitans cavernicola]|uniref:Winged helix-turn-helix transcriptional regulator n=2 Tax=Antrihabitans cavernicola TaxID=2495913 RepID=A0A5A7SFK3_9NOCA|nr:winged helix-turn-helix transcriptional regulator [Spelaeibacter cavernicola]
MLLWQVTNKWQAAQRAALAPVGLTHVQFVLLAALTWQSGKGAVITQRELADHAATDPMMTSQVLRTLQEKKLVERAAHPTDGRAKAIRPTEAGAALANKANAIVEECDRSFFGTLGDDVSVLVTSLRTLRDGAR